LAPSRNMPLHPLKEQTVVVKFGEGKEVPLSQAIRERKILAEMDASSSGLGIRFVNKTGQDAEIEFKTATLFADRADRNTGGTHLEEVKPGETEAQQEEIQNRVWKVNQEKRLQETLQAAARARTVKDLQAGDPDTLQLSRRNGLGEVTPGVDTFYKD